MDDYIRAEMERQHIPGLSLAVVQKGELKKSAHLARKPFSNNPSCKKMWTPAKFNNGKDSTYGFGWGVENSSGQRLVSHTGSQMTGFTSAILRYLDSGLTVIVLTNQRGANLTAIAKGVAGFYSPEIKMSAGK